MMRITVIHDISVDIPPRRRPFSDEERDLEFYLIVILEACHDHRTQPSYRAASASAKQQRQRFSERKLQLGVESRDGPAMFEHCMRTIAHIVQKDINGAVPSEILGSLGEVAKIPTIYGPAAATRNNTRTLALQSLGVVVWLLFRQYFIDTAAPSLHAVRSYPHMRNIVRFANVCAEGGFVPPVVLRVAGWFATFRVRFGVDARDAMPELFRNRAHLWPAYEAYVERQIDRERKRLAKVMKNPHLYVCAGTGCRIQASKKGTLRQCGGDCPPEGKPSYCSVQCQIEHWRVHRFTCKEGVVAGPCEDDNDPDWEDVEVCENIVKMQDINLEGSWTTKRGRELFIDIVNPSRARRGELLRVRSKTLDPTFLKWYDLIWANKRRVPFRNHEPGEEEWD